MSTNPQLKNREPLMKRLAYDERYRLQYHFSPPAGWINDPNGMVYYAGEYHLFYQHYPHDTVWGPMYWGHAVSTDLCNWTHLPIALEPDELGYIFSGSAVVDWQDTAGFGKEALIAIFTHHNPATIKQSQSIAFSLDKGRTWTKYVDNPVIPPHEQIDDFRDPKVFWYEAEGEDGWWVLLLAAADVILFYRSTNLREWEPTGRFGDGYGAKRGVWETPDLFELPVGEGPEKRWVLTVGINPGAPAGGSGMQYFVGQFDGNSFVSDNPQETILWADYGADFYAAQSWSDVEDGRRLWLAWLNDWRYANQIPTDGWRGAMSLPRQLKLVHMQDGIRLAQTPVTELKHLRASGADWRHVPLQPEEPFVIEPTAELLEVVADICPSDQATHCGIIIHFGSQQQLVIKYDIAMQELSIDRTSAGDTAFYPAFAETHRCRLALESQQLQLRLFIDHSAIELFANDGIATFAERLFPQHPISSISFFTAGGSTTLRSLACYELNAAQFTQ